MAPAAAMLLIVAVQACGLPGRASGPGGKYRRCASVRDSGDGTVTAGKATCAWDGHAGLCKPPAADVLDLCLVAGMSGDPDTGKSLGAFVEWCRKGGAEAIVALGDVGRSEEEMILDIGVLSSAGVPVLTLPGGSEDYGDYLEAIEKSREKGLPVVDLSRVRVLEWGGTVLVTLPGIARPRYLAHRGDGCGWGPDDVEELETLLGEASGKGRVVVLGAYPPLGSGGPGIDTSREGSHVGDAGLAAALDSAGVATGAFGFVYEAGGTAVDPSTRSLVPPGTWADGLLLNPGSIEALPWVGTGAGGYSTGQAAVLHVGSDGVAYHVWRAGEEAR